MELPHPTAGAPWKEPENCFQQGNLGGHRGCPLRPQLPSGGQDIPTSGGALRHSCSQGSSSCSSALCIRRAPGWKQPKEVEEQNLPQNLMSTSLHALVHCCHIRQNPRALPKLGQCSWLNRTAVFLCSHCLSCSLSPLNRKEKKNIC